MNNTPTLTKEQRERLQPMAMQLEQAFKADYCTGMSTAKATTMFAVYEEVYRRRGGCPTCPADVLNVAKQLGKLYFAPADAIKSDEGITTPPPTRKPRKTQKKTK